MVPESTWVRLDDVRKTIPETAFMKDGKTDAVARMWRANELGRAMASSALEVGKTAFVDAIKYQAEWVEPWEALGQQVGATVLDICLIAPKAVIEERAARRGYRAGGRLTPEKVSVLYDKVVSFYANRPDAIIIDNEYLTVDETAEFILAQHMTGTTASGTAE